MARSVILKARVSPAEYDALVAQLKPSQSLSDLIRARLGIDGNPHCRNQAMKVVVARGGQTAMSVKPCPVAKYCIWRKDGGCTSPKYTTVCPLGAEAWELL